MNEAIRVSLVSLGCARNLVDSEVLLGRVVEEGLQVVTDPEDADIAFGLCDLGLGYPELGSVRLSVLKAHRGRLGLPIERDLHFKANAPLSTYAERAREAGGIVT